MSETNEILNQIITSTNGIKYQALELAQGPLVVTTHRETYRSTEVPGLVVTMNITCREGFTVEMANDTKAHYLHAAKLLYEGRHLDVTDTQWTSRKEWNPVSSRYGEPRVLIYGDMTVKRENDAVILSVNKFTEYTTAQDLIGHMMKLVSVIKQPDRVVAPATQAARQALGNGGQQHRVGSTPAAPAPDGASDSGTPHFDLMPRDKPSRMAFGEQYDGKQISTTITKIARVFSKKDGTPEWECYNKTDDKYPVVYINPATSRGLKEETTDMLLNTMNVGGEMLGQWRVVVHVAYKDSTKTPGEKVVYYNPIKLESQNAAPQAVAAPKTVAQSFMDDYGLKGVPPYGDGPDEQDAAEEGIPF